MASVQTGYTYGERRTDRNVEHTIVKKSAEKLSRYIDLHTDIARLWDMGTTRVAIISGALGSILRSLNSNLEMLGTKSHVPIVQNCQQPMKGSI